MSRALFNVGWRYLLLRRWHTLLMVLGIALGVAVVVAIDLANASASRSFELSTEIVAGKTTHLITGGPQGVDEQVYTRLRLEQPGITAAPQVSETVTAAQLGDRPLTLLGIDPFADAPFHSFFGAQGRSGGGLDLAVLSSFLTRPGALLISKPLAQRYGLQAGDEITLQVGGKPRTGFIAGLLIPADTLSERSLDGTLLADISTAQEITDQEGKLSEIDLILPENDPQAARRLAEWLPKGYRLEESAARSGTLQEMTAAFRLNLSALSLLALIVGLFLIYNTMTFSVVQRRSLFGTLRCLGVTRREVFGLVLSEACVVGLLGGGLGIGLGLLLGQETVRMVTQTVNDLYFTSTVQSTGVDPLSLVKGAGLGWLATVLTAALPAYEASSVPPRVALLRSGLESKVRAGVGKTALAGGLCGVLGAASFLIPSSSLVLGFTGTLAVVVAAALLSSAALVGLMRAAGPVTAWAFGLVGQMAPRNLVKALSRTAVAVAALMVAVAVIIGVALMVDSFRYTVILWLEQTLQGDVYVSVPSYNATHSSAAIDPAVVQSIRAWPGVARVITQRSSEVDARLGPQNASSAVVLSATDNSNLGQERLFASLNRPKSEVWDALSSGGVLVSEPLANRLGLQARNGTLELYTPQGWQSFGVVGVYYDYSSSQGVVVMAQEVYRRLWQDSALTTLAIKVQPGISPDELATELQDHLPGGQDLLIRPNAALRRDVLVVFDRTFAITVALRLLATVVAFIGVLNALLLLQLEKGRELGILRALGLTGAQLWQLVMVETGLMGLVAGLLAMPTGYALALILVYVINRRSFGWTLQMAVHPGVFAQAVGIALAAALLAGVYPALKLGRMPAAEAIRYE